MFLILHHKNPVNKKDYTVFLFQPFRRAEEQQRFRLHIHNTVNEWPVVPQGIGQGALGGAAQLSIASEHLGAQGVESVRIHSKQGSKFIQRFPSGPIRDHTKSHCHEKGRQQGVLPFGAALPKQLHSEIPIGSIRVNAGDGRKILYLDLSRNIGDWLHLSIWGIDRLAGTARKQDNGQYKRDWLFLYNKGSSLTFPFIKMIKKEKVPNQADHNRIQTRFCAPQPHKASRMGMRD